MADQLDDEISSDELAALLGGMDAPSPSEGALENQSAKLDDEISADELAALGLASLPSKAREGEQIREPAGHDQREPLPERSPLPSSDGEQGSRDATGGAGAGPGPKLPELTAQNDITADAGISLLMDVPLRVSIELGRVSMTLQQVLGLGRGSIIELERLAGEPVDILVNDKLIGRGEVVVIDEYFGVKITELIDPKG